MLVVSSEENMRNLEQIRTDHLKSIGLMSGTPTTKTRPSVIWMSYNVHGNEATNSAAFPKVLHELLAGGAVADKILKNAIVILAPCLNPDGHDRYVNWYNQKKLEFRPMPTLQLGNMESLGRADATIIISLTPIATGHGKPKK